MPDISMCENKECPLKTDCYIFRAIPNDLFQPYTNFEYDENGECEYFMEIYEGDKITNLEK